MDELNIWKVCLEFVLKLLTDEQLANSVLIANERKAHADI